MMPTGTDEAFEYNFPMDARSIGYPLIYDDFKVQSKNRGSMFTRCLRVKACLNEYLDQLKFVSDTAGTMGLKKEMATIASMLAPYNAASVWAQTSAQNWVDMKRGEVRKLLQKYGR
jgi:DNA-binding protein Fis